MVFISKKWYLYCSNVHYTLKNGNMKLEMDLFKIKYNDIKPKQGRVLISAPFADDSFFSRSVVLLTEYNKEGSVGFALNKPVKKMLPEISTEFGDFNAPVFLGGPVSRDNIYYVHTLGDKIPDSIKIKNNLYWGGDYKILKKLIDQGEVKTSQIRFFVGYSGWEENQLDTEIKEDSWLVSDISSENVMDYTIKIWKKMVSKLGESYKAWTNFPENPNFN